MERLIRIPIVKHGIYLWKLVTKDEKFWQAIILRRIYTLKERGVKEQEFTKIINTLGNENKSKILKSYAFQFFLKNFVDNLLVGVILTGLFDLMLHLNLKTFVMFLFFWTLVFSLIDLAAYIRVEFTAIDKREDIVENAMRIYRGTEKYTLDKIIEDF